MSRTYQSSFKFKALRPRLSFRKRTLREEDMIQELRQEHPSLFN